jgi:hypothetical protein
MTRRRISPYGMPKARPASTSPNGTARIAPRRISAV